VRFAAGAVCAVSLTIAATGPAAGALRLQEPAADVVAEVRVHGNTMTPTADVLSLAALPVGTPYADRLLDEARARLLASGKFDDVQVLKRFASIADPSRILVMIVVDERPARIVAGKQPGELPRLVPRRGPRNLMLLPLVEAEDGYGLTYGARVAFVDVGGKQGRVTVPLSWGGTRQAGATFERGFATGLLTRWQAGGEITQRTNPAYEQTDQRQRVWTRAERRAGPLGLGVTLAHEHVDFAAAVDKITSLAGDVTFDTRVDPFLARNAVYLYGGLTRIRLSPDASVNRGRVEARGYLGVFRRAILVARVEGDSASQALPPYLQPMLGGWSTLRGFKAGSFVGDQRVAGSLELRVPLSSALRVARLGVSAFVDAGASYDVGERIQDQPWQQGSGGAVWVSATAFRFALSVASGRHADTRVNFAMGYGF
jgi:outer membrane protein assembly factor BamA